MRPALFLLASLLCHLLLLRVGWRPVAERAEPRSFVHVRLRSVAPPRPELTPSEKRQSAWQAGPVRNRRHRAPAPAPPAPEPAAPVAPPRPVRAPERPTLDAPTGVPRAVRRGGRPAAAPDEVASAPVSGPPQAGGDTTAPVLLNAPQQIPLPEVLKTRGGHCQIVLRCRIGADASSEVSVLDGTGMAELDLAIMQSFSHRRWYPAEGPAGPLAMTVKLIIEASWETGSDFIHWRGRVPR